MSPSSSREMASASSGTNSTGQWLRGREHFLWAEPASSNTDINATFSDVSRDLHLQNTASRFVDGTEWSGKDVVGAKFSKVPQPKFPTVLGNSECSYTCRKLYHTKDKRIKNPGKDSDFLLVAIPKKPSWKKSDPGATLLPKATSIPFLTLSSVACRSYPRKVIFHDTQIQREQILKWEWLNLICVHLK